MRVEVSLGSNDNAASEIFLSVIDDKPAMRAHGIAVLRKEMFDRKILSIDTLVSNELMLPASTVEVKENIYFLSHRGIVTGLSLSISLDDVSTAYTVEAV